jgi:hypothetical protein
MYMALNIFCQYSADITQSSSITARSKTQLLSSTPRLHRQTPSHRVHVRQCGDELHKVTENLFFGHVRSGLGVALDDAVKVPAIGPLHHKLQRPLPLVPVGKTLVVPAGHRTIMDTTPARQNPSASTTKT